MTITDGIVDHHLLFWTIFSLFWGQMPIFSWVTPTFFSQFWFFIGFLTSSEKIYGCCRWKNGHLTLETSLISWFWGKFPIFHELYPLFFLQVDSSFNWTTFGLFWTKCNHFETISYHFGVFFGVISNHCGQFLLISQHIWD